MDCFAAVKTSLRKPRFLQTCFVLGALFFAGHASGQTFFKDCITETVKCINCQPGDVGTAHGITYTAVDNATLASMAANHTIFDLNTLCTTLVTDMNSLFHNQGTFNQDISNWDVSNVTEMNLMFAYANSFNQDIGNWETHNVENMQAMFFEATSYYGHYIGNWDVSSVTNMHNMFNGASFFGESIASWDVSNVVNMNQMLAYASSFQDDLSSWCVANVASAPSFSLGTIQVEGFDPIWGTCPSCTDPAADNYQPLADSEDGSCYYFFLDADGLTIKCTNCQPWDKGDVDGTTYVAVDDGVFETLRFELNTSCTSFLDQICTTTVTNMQDVLHNDPIPWTIRSWDVSNVTNMYRMLSSTSCIPDITHWDVSSVTNMQDMFNGTFCFNQEIGTWDVSNVTNMKAMFANSVINNDITGWDVSSVTDMREMFKGTLHFNRDIGGWNVQSVEQMGDMFEDALSFNQDLSGWCVSEIQDLPAFPSAPLWGFSNGSPLIEAHAPVWGTCPFGCTDPLACNYNPNAASDDGSCLGGLGCSAPSACNYDPTAACDDGSCSYPGCMDPVACNYDPASTCETGITCVYVQDPVVDLTDYVLGWDFLYYADCGVDASGAGTIFFDPDGTWGNDAWGTLGDWSLCSGEYTHGYTGFSTLYEATWNGTSFSGTFDDGLGWSGCFTLAPSTAGCTDPTATNYDPTATTDNGSCTYSYNVTFRLDLNSAPPEILNPEVNDSFNGWCGNCNPLSDPDGDGIWETTLQLPGGDYLWKFSSNNWEYQETPTDPAEAPCFIFDEFGFVNRSLTVTGDMILPAYCWESCALCLDSEDNQVVDVWVCPGAVYSLPDGTALFDIQSDTTVTSINPDASLTITNVMLESLFTIETNYDCVNDQLEVSILDMGTFNGTPSPAWDFVANGQSYTVDAPGTTYVPGVTPDQTWRLAMFETNNCAPDYLVYPDCFEAPCTDQALERVPNGNFDNLALQEWTEIATFLDGTDTGYGVLSDAYTYDESALAAWFGGFDQGSVNTLDQDIYLPETTETTRLTWRQWETGGCAADDVFTVYIDDVAIHSQTAADNPNCGQWGWYLYTVDIGAYATGDTYNLKLEYTQNGTNGFTNLFVDNVSILTCPCLPDLTELTVQVCQWDSYTFPDGTTVESINEGFVQYSYSSPPPCLVGIVTTIEVLPVNVAFVQEEVCHGETYTYADGTSIVVNAQPSGTYQTFLQGVNGCDSVVYEAPIYIPEILEFEDVSLCEGDSHTFPDGTLTTNITLDFDYASVLTSTQGCDSVVTTQVTVIPAGCADPLANNYDPAALCFLESICTYDAALGCMDVAACNYNPDATIDDGSCAIIPGDLNNDCVVGTQDLLIVIGDFGCLEFNCPLGPEDTPDCVANLNGDCQVSATDVLFVLGLFGTGL